MDNSEPSMATTPESAPTVATGRPGPAPWAPKWPDMGFTALGPPEGRSKACTGVSPCCPGSECLCGKPPTCGHSLGHFGSTWVPSWPVSCGESRVEQVYRQGLCGYLEQVDPEGQEGRGWLLMILPTGPRRVGLGGRGGFRGHRTARGAWLGQVCALAGVEVTGCGVLKAGMQWGEEERQGGWGSPKGAARPKRVLVVRADLEGQGGLGKYTSSP